MTLIKSLACDGCGTCLSWRVPRSSGSVTKSFMEQMARNAGWNAPDKVGSHWCKNCRRQDGRGKRKT